MKSRSYVLVSTVLAFTFISMSVLMANEPLPTDATEIMARMDKTISGFSDQEMVMTMIITDSDATSKSYDFWLKQKKDKRLVHFTSGEVKGMSVLTIDRNVSYVYLPGFKRVRRISASNMKQTMAGSDFTNDDMASTHWSSMCVASMEKEIDDAWYIRCTPESGMDTPYAYLVFKVLKDGYYQSEVTYFDSDNFAYKRLVASNMKEWKKGVRRFSHVEMTDLATNHKTVLEIHQFIANQGFKDSMFTVRQLKWGR